MAGSLTNAVEIEVDTLNDHKCMATLISLIQFLNDNGIINKASQDSQVSVGILSDTLVLFDCCCHGSRSNARKSVVLQINCQISSSISICFIFLCSNACWVLSLKARCHPSAVVIAKRPSALKPYNKIQSRNRREEVYSDTANIELEFGFTVLTQT